MKKKIAVLCLCAALLTAAAIGGTIAYFTDEKVADNTFSFSKNVSISLDETDITKDDGSRTENGNEYKDVYPGQTVDKDPIVHVADDSANCYVRAFVTVTNKDALLTIASKYGLHFDDVVDGLSDKWALFNKDQSREAFVFEFRYVEELEAGGYTEAIFESITFPEELTEEDGAALSGLSISVKAEAVQSAGFDTYTDAWTAIDA